MGLAIVIKGADFSASKLPKLRPTIKGFPAVGLAGLYLLQDGDEGSHTGTFVDSSGNGNHGEIVGDYVTPAQRSYGVEVLDGAGLVINTGIQQPSDFTVIGCLKSSMDNATASGWPAWFGDTENQIPLTKAAPGDNGPRLAPNQDFSGTQIASNGVYAQDGIMLPFSRHSYGASEHANERVVMGMRVAGDVVSLRSLGGKNFTHTDPDIKSGYENQTGKMCVGYWKHGGFTGLAAELYGFAIWDRALSDEEYIAALDAMGKHAEAQGVSVVR